MLDRIGKGILVTILTAGVLLGAYLAYTRYFIELQDKTVELCVDLNDVKKMAAYEKVPLGTVLDELRKRDVLSIGVFEETLPDANAAGELYWTKGLGIVRLQGVPSQLWTLYDRGLIRPDKTYIYVPEEKVRLRVDSQLRCALGDPAVKVLEKDVLEVDEAEEELRTLPLGISESQRKYLEAKGFRIVPRIWNDPRYNLGNLDKKISFLSDYGLVIFDGEDILGYPDAIKPLAAALKQYKVKYGYIEVVQQYGKDALRRYMGRDIVRVHSVSRDELKKLNRDTVVPRFGLAARERGIRFFYIRPFLPPQIDAPPVTYNLKYLDLVRAELHKSGFVFGRAEAANTLETRGWMLLLLGLGVVIGAFFLLDYFIETPLWLIYLVLILSGGVIILAGGAGYGILTRKLLALLCAAVFPALAVISSLSEPRSKNLTLMVLDVIAETLVGVFLLVGLLADYRFMLGVETFAGVKMALLLPIAIVAYYFMTEEGQGIRALLETRVKLIAVGAGLLVLAALAVLIARSDNFVIPVLGIEKYFRSLLETVMMVRPRTKEFLVGYPFLYLAVLAFNQGKKQWLWLLAAIGTIAPISIMNSFSHIHTPFIVSMVRTVNGLALGIMVGLLTAWAVSRFVKQ